MTREQTEWMRTHPQYRFVGRAPSFGSFKEQGVVTPEGKFEKLAKGQAAIRTGDIHVGIFLHTPPAEYAPLARESK